MNPSMWLHFVCPHPKSFSHGARDFTFMESAWFFDEAKMAGDGWYSPKSRLYAVMVFLLVLGC